MVNKGLTVPNPWDSESADLAVNLPELGWELLESLLWSVEGSLGRLGGGMGPLETDWSWGLDSVAE